MTPDEPLVRDGPGELDNAAELRGALWELFPHDLPDDRTDHALVDDHQDRRHTTVEHRVDGTIDARLEVGSPFAARVLEALPPFPPVLVADGVLGTDLVWDFFSRDASDDVERPAN